MYTKGDFHLHTNASDGKLSPKDLIIAADKVNLDILAVTDHDSTNGVDEAIQIGLKYNIKVIPGIELSTLHNGESIHILGYFKDDSYKSKEFQSFLDNMKEYRYNRGKKIIEKLDTYFNIKLDYNKILEDAKGVIARSHIAKAIISQGYDYDWKYIFNNFLSKDSPAFVPNLKVTISEGISMLKNLNAIVSLAHPVLIKNSTIDDLLKFDFDAVEAIYPLNALEDTEFFMSKANEYNKIITAGSDFHGLGKNDTSHGNIGDAFLSEDRLNAFIKEYMCS